MRRTFTLDELRSAQADPKSLDDLIKESGGYALTKMRKANLMPKLEVLMQCASADSLAFMLDYYDLNQDQKKQIAPFFRKSTASPKLSKKRQTESDVDDVLIQGEPLREGTVLTLRQLREFVPQIKFQCENDDFDTETILKASVDALSLGEFLSLDRVFLKSNAHLFNHLSHFYSNSEFKQTYKDLMAEIAEQDGNVLTWKDFECWPFKAEDQDFLWELLLADGKRRKPTYEDCVKIPGAQALIDPWSFCARVNPGDLGGLSLQDIQEHKEEIQNAWVGLIENESYGRMSSLIEFGASVEQFKAVVDGDCAMKLLKKSIRMDTDSMWREDSDSKNKSRHIKRSILQGVLDGEWFKKEFFDSYEVSRLIGFLNDDSYGQPVPQEDVELCARATMEMLPVFFATSSPAFSDTMLHGGSGWVGHGNLENVARLAQNKPSVNLLVLALHEWRERSESKGFHERRHVKDVEDIVCALLERVEASSASMARKAFGFKARAEPNKEPLARVASTPENDMFAFDYAHLFDLPEKTRLEMLDTDWDFERKLAAKGLQADESLMLHALWRGSTRHLKALKTLIDSDLSGAMSMPSLVSALVKHEHGASMIDIDKALGGPDSRARQSGPGLDALMSTWAAVQDALELNSALCEKAKIKGEGSLDDDFYTRESSRDRKKSGKLDALEKTREDISNRADSYEKQARAWVGSLPFDVVERKISQSLQEGRYALFANIGRCASASHATAERFAARALEIGLHEFIDLIRSDKAFAKLVKDAVGYDGATKIKLDFGSPQENALAAKALLGLFKDGPTKVFALFEPEACVAFSNAFALEYFPRLVPYSYDLAPKGRLGALAGIQRNFIERPYTDAQVMELWERLEAGEGFFCNADVNAGFSNFFKSNFEGDFKRYAGFLEKAKKHPKLYCLLCNADLAQEFEAEWREKPIDNEPRVSRDKARLRMTQACFDWDVLMEGVGMIFDEMQARQGSPGFNGKLAAQAVDSVIWATYYDEVDASGQTVYASEFGEEKSEKFLRMMCQKAPLYVYSTHALGSIADVAARFAENTGAYLGADGLEKIFFAPSAHKHAHFSISNRFEGYASKILEGALHWMISQGRSEDLEYLDWAIKQMEFKNQELSYGSHSLGSKPRSPEPYDEILEYVSTNGALRKLLSVAMERLDLEEALGDNKTRREKVRRL